MTHINKEAQISLDKMTKAFEKLIEDIKKRGVIKRTERTLEEKISSWDNRLEKMQNENYPLILQRACFESLLKLMTEKIRKDHC